MHRFQTLRLIAVFLIMGTMELAFPVYAQDLPSPSNPQQKVVPLTNPKEKENIKKDIPAKTIDSQTENQETDQAHPDKDNKKDPNNPDQPKSNTEPTEETNETPPPAAEKSAVSILLTDKLVMSVGSGFALIDSSKGDWATKGTGDLSISYLIKKEILKNTSLLVTFRYHPIDVIVEEPETEYRGIVEGFLFGSQANYYLNPRISAVATAELGYLKTSIKPMMTTITSDDDVKSSGVNFLIGGGADWKFLEKILLGPRLIFGSGRFTTIQLSANVGLIF